MEKPRILSGEALVAKGITKIDSSLPEVGLKDVTPNGSWLEQKQIQAALEARKYLIEVERIEKCGTLSHAEWRDDLMLAEVTQKAGGYWQYLGHNVGKMLYLRPEEALFLMEINCLLLKHNEVTVSLQKAYSLLLRSSTTMLQYKVYASLSRLGYRVFKHMGPKADNENKSWQKDELKKVDSPTISSDNRSNIEAPIANTDKSEPINSTTVISGNNSDNVDFSIVNAVESKHDNEPVPNTVSDVKSSPIVDRNIETDSTVKDSTVEESENIDSLNEPQSIEVPENSKLSEVVKESNENNVEMSEIKDIAAMTEKCDDLNVVTKEYESPNSMEVDNTVELKSSHNKAENNEEVSSTENNETTMEICTENQEAGDSGIVLMEDDDRLDGSNKIQRAITTITSDVLMEPGTLNIEDTTAPQEDLSNNNVTNIANNCTMTEKITQKYYCNKYPVYNYLSKIEKITTRQQKPSDSKNFDKYFENIPDFSKERVVTLKGPEQQFIPKNIFVNNHTYLLNLQNIKKRSIRSASSESPSYASSDEVNGTNIRRIRSSSATQLPPNVSFFSNVRYPGYNHFRPYGFWRPQNNLSIYQLMFFQTRVQYHQRPHPLLRTCFNFNPNNPTISNNARKRMRNGKSAHLQGIKNLAVRLKQSLMSGNTDMGNLETLHGLLHSYNLRYKARLRLKENFDVVNEEKIVETIELDDDEESKSKKPRLEQGDSDNFDENLYRLRQLALRLRDLETKDKATASHRRAFSKAIKTFNKSYNADVYLNEDNYEVVDRRCITLDSSSESDCVVEEKPVRSKKLRNPFNILKRRSERLHLLNNPGTSKDETSDTCNAELNLEPIEDNNKYSELILKTFNETWLPNETDFGRAEIVPKRYMNSRLIFSTKEQFLYEFMKDQFQQYENWLEAKVSFLRYLDGTNFAFKSEQAKIQAESELNNSSLKPLVDFEDSSDMPSVLEKLRIIRNNKDFDIETSLKIHFDVYNRDVQNFRKRNPPKPHFRIICIDESSGVPSAAEVIALHSQYKDNVSIVFAIVGIASISYLQINPIDLPIYVPSNDAV